MPAEACPAFKQWSGSRLVGKREVTRWTVRLDSGRGDKLAEILSKGRLVPYPFEAFDLLEAGLIMCYCRLPSSCSAWKSANT